MQMLKRSFLLSVRSHQSSLLQHLHTKKVKQQQKNACFCQAVDKKKSPLSPCPFSSSSGCFGCRHERTQLNPQCQMLFLLIASAAGKVCLAHAPFGCPSRPARRLLGPVPVAAAPVRVDPGREGHGGEQKIGMGRVRAMNNIDFPSPLNVSNR